MSTIRTTSSTATASPQQTSTTGIPHDKIAMRAYEKWCKRGRPQGTEKQDWLEAEHELKMEVGRASGMQTGQTRR